MADWTPPEGHGGRWIRACILGLGAGTVLSAVWIALLLPMLLPGRAGFAAVPFHALGGAIAGAALGTTQAAALRRAYADFPAGGWIGATAAAGYGVALLTALLFRSLAEHAGSIPVPVFIIVGAVAKGVLGGLLYGPLQGRVLDRVVTERASWTRVVMVGWMLGALLGSMRWLLGLPLDGLVPLLLAALAGGAVEGLALGLVTAGAFRFMPPRPAR